MKLTVEAIVFSTGTYTRPSDGTESRYLRLKAATTSGKVATYTFWDSMASALETTLNNYVPEGMSLADIRLLLSLDGEFHLEKAGGRSFRTKGFSVLAGPAAELHRVRNGAMAAMATARAAAERGAFQEAYGTLLRHFEHLTRATEVEAPTDSVDAAPLPPVVEAQLVDDGVSPPPAEQAPLVSEHPEVLSASVAEAAATVAPCAEVAVEAPADEAVLVSPPTEPAAPEPEPKPAPPVARPGLSGFGRGRFAAAPAATASSVAKPALPADVTPRPAPSSPAATVAGTAPARSPASRGGLSLSREQQAKQDYSQEPPPSVASSGLARPPQSVSGAPRFAARRGGLSFE